MSDIKLALEHILTRRDGYQHAETYYEGSMPEVFLDQKWYRLFKNPRHDFRFNFSKTVVDSVLNRLEISQVSSDSEEAKSYLDRIFNQTDIKLDINEIHRNALIYGDCYAIVWPDMNGELVIDYNSPLTTAMVYDAENPRIKKFATKMFQTEDSTGRKIIRLNIYYPDRIEKYEGMGELETMTIGNQSLFKLIETVDNPWGEIPVFHFRTYRQYGKPEHLDAFGPQDAINKLIATHMLTVDYQGAPQRYALSGGGSTAELNDFSEDDTARENIGALQNGPGQLWYLQGVTSVGQFQAADPDTFTKPVMEFVNAMASITSTPTHYFVKGSYIPSGAALRVAEAPLFKKVLNRQLAFGSTWRDLFKFMFKVENINAEVQIDWVLPESIDSLEQWDIALRKRSAGMPLSQILLELGYDPAIVQQITAASPGEQNVSLASAAEALNANNLALQQNAAEEQQANA